MVTTKRDSFRGAPRTAKRTENGKGGQYLGKTSSRRTDDFREERSERRPSTRSYGFDRGDDRREPMHVMRAPYKPRRTFEPAAAGPAPTSPAPARETATAVPAYKLKKGFEAAKAEIYEMIDTISGTMAESFNVSEVEIAVSFNSDGKFIGFGDGGAATIKIRIAPADV
ncbi:MAG: hypothetical protein PHN75_17950 [Syntrophales bacterium]|nr:hypothetical protein [Syntrophales bacterium]